MKKIINENGKEDKFYVKMDDIDKGIMLTVGSSDCAHRIMMTRGNGEHKDKMIFCTVDKSVYDFHMIVDFGNVSTPTEGN